MPRLLLPACCLLLLSLSAARAEDAKPLAVFPMRPDRMPFVTLSFGGKDYRCAANPPSHWADCRLSSGTILKQTH